MTGIETLGACAVENRLVRRTGANSLSQFSRSENLPERSGGALAWGAIARAFDANTAAVLRCLRMATVFVALLAAATALGDSQVNVNTADAETIAKALTGVGIAKAKAIVEFRESNGRFNDPEELTRVKGIGESTLRRNEGRIVVSERDRTGDETAE